MRELIVNRKLGPPSLSRTLCRCCFALQLLDPVRCPKLLPQQFPQLLVQRIGYTLPFISRLVKQPLQFLEQPQQPRLLEGELALLLL